MNKREAKIEALQGIIDMEDIIYEAIADRTTGSSAMEIIQKNDKISAELVDIIYSLRKRKERLEKKI